MEYFGTAFDWDDEDAPRSNTRHIRDAGYTEAEFESVFDDPHAVPTRSRSSKRHALFGKTVYGEFVFVVY
jgi:hypothetical protein